MEIGQTAAGELACDMVEGRLRIRILHVVERVDRRHTHADTICSPHRRNGGNYFDQQPCPVFDRAAISVRPLVRTVAQELVDEIAVCTMDLHTVKARRPGVDRCLAIVSDDAPNLSDAKLPRLDERLESR